MLIPASRARADDCDEGSSLRKRVSCWVERIQAGGEFRLPGPQARSAWRDTIGAMLEGQCDELELPLSLAGYQVSRMTDEDSGRELCLLQEGPESSLGWGSFIVAASSSRPVHLLVPHPVHDVGTAEQAADIMLHAGARSALIAGAARWVEAEGGCGDRPASDPTHSPHTMFQPTVDALAQAAEDELLLQLHGMAESSCGDVDVYLTHGSSAPAAPDGVLSELQRGMATLRPGWTVSVPGHEEAPSCRLHGSRNVQARLLGGVEPGRVCERAPERPNPRFVHVEQKPWARLPDVWVELLEKTLTDGPP